MPTEEQEAARAGATQGALSGAGQGAALGATVGTAAGPIGTVVGGVVGAVAGAVAGGLLGAKRAKDAYNEAEAAQAKRDRLARQATYEQNRLAKEAEAVAFKRPVAAASGGNDPMLRAAGGGQFDSWYGGVFGG
ncbi:MAG TPA: hypothetical protein VI911_04380 [Patescibacteria group bacterium]|nr:hypothetical protein [Patescibacteria group bacterium]